MTLQNGSSAKPETPDVDSLHIGDLADATGLSLRTLRHYDEVGLLRASGRSQGGFRLYTKLDLQRLMVIRRMKPLGYSLEEMAALLKLLDTLGALGSLGSSNNASDGSAQLDEFIRDAHERRASLQRQLEMADEFITSLERFVSSP